MPGMAGGICAKSHMVSIFSSFLFWGWLWKHKVSCLKDICFPPCYSSRCLNTGREDGGLEGKRQPFFSAYLCPWWKTTACDLLVENAEQLGLWRQRKLVFLLVFKLVFSGISACKKGLKTLPSFFLPSQQIHLWASISICSAKQHEFHLVH